MGIINKLKINSMRRKKSFTLIEMIVVIATIGLVLPTLFAIIFSILQQQVKIQRLSIVKREGDYVLNVIENTIRNYGESIHSATPPTESNKICQSSSLENASYFKDKFGNWFRFYLDTTNSISSESSVLNNGSPGSVSLNSSQTKITNFSIQCYKTSLYSPPVVNISFTIEYNTTSLRVEEKVTPLTYQTKVKLKSY
jgi:type II secretory pathway pseudopilin PulG